MARWCNDDMLDAALNYIKTNCDKVCLCDGQPATYAEATSTLHVTSEDAVTGDFTLANGDVSGRKLTYAGVVGSIADAAGTPDHVAFVKTGTSTLLFVTTMSEITLTLAQEFDILPLDIELSDPAAPA